MPSMIHILIFTFLSCDNEDPILTRASSHSQPTPIGSNENQSNSELTEEKIVNEPLLLSEASKNTETLVSDNTKISEHNDLTETIIVSGNVTVEQWSGKKIKIDVFDGDQRMIDGPRPSVIKVEIIESPGSFSFEIPRVQKNLWIGAHIDEDNDGKPGPNDPFAWFNQNPIVGNRNITDINLVLKIPKHSED